MEDRKEQMKKDLQRIAASLPPEKLAGVLWVMENIDTIDRISSGEKLPMLDIDEIATDAVIRRDYHALALILYMKIKYCEEEYIGSYFF